MKSYALPPSVPLRDDFMARRIEPLPDQTNPRMERAVIRGLADEGPNTPWRGRDDRRATIELLRSCAVLPPEMGSDRAGRRGRPRKHPIAALLAVLVARYFWHGRKSALLSRNDVVMNV